MMDEEIRQALCEVREMKKMCGNINMKLTNIVTQRGQDFKKKLEAEYQRGFEDGVTKRTDGDACAGCEYKGKTGEHLPCHYCENAYTNQWRAKKEEIGAGDVVKTYNGITYVVTKATIDGIVVGFAGDGGTCRFALSEVTYTGRHYNINEILGGLCDDD